MSDRIPGFAHQILRKVGLIADNHPGDRTQKGAHVEETDYDAQPRMFIADKEKHANQHFIAVYDLGEDTDQTNALLSRGILVQDNVVLSQPEFAVHLLGVDC